MAEVKASVNDNLEALFDEEDGEFIDENQEENEDEDIDLLAEFMDEDEQAANKEENSSTMEEEYLELEKKMAALKEKMGQNKSPDSSMRSNNSQKQLSTKENDSKRSFMSAFGNKNDLQTESHSSDISGVLKTVPQNKAEIKSIHCGEETAQKRRRISHKESEDMTHSAKIKTTSGSSSSFYSQPPVNPVPKQNVLSRTGNKVQANRPLQKEGHFEIEIFSRIRLKERFVPNTELSDLMKSKTHLKLSLIRPTLKLSADSDWVTIAVVAKQMDPQTAKNGKKFSIWHLSDLSDCTKHVTFFLFGKVHEELWRKITVGCVIGLLNPSIMPPKKDDFTGGKSFDNTPALTVDLADRVMKIGISADLGWCTATKFRNKQPAGKCLSFINKQFGETCVFHTQSKYKKMSSKRGELQGSVAGAPLSEKYKKTMWNKVKGDQFFYGGQTFSAAPPSTNPNVQRKESKMKLTQVLNGVKSKESPLQQREKLQRSRIMQAISGIKEEQSVSGCSDLFADMLSSGDMAAGSKQFLNHLQQKQKIQKEVAEPKPVLSPAQFLKEQKQFIDEKKKAKQKQPFNQKTTNYVSATDIKKCTEELIRMKKANALKRKQDVAATKPGEASLKPKRNMNLSSVPTQLKSPALGSGDANHIDLFGDWLSNKKSIPTTPTLSLAELRKRKAIAKLKSESGSVDIKKSNPNLAVIEKSKEIKTNQKLQEKVKNIVQSNRKDLQNKEAENITEKPKNKLEGFGSKISNSEFQNILNAKSSHSDSLDLAEMERTDNYFNPLIQKEMMEEKMAETFEMPAKVVECVQCNYTFWVPHDRCKQLQHSLAWRKVKKRFFECTNCKQRTTTWEPYPTKVCKGCGNDKTWKKTCMLKTKDAKLDSELLLIRGIEHSKFLNSMQF